MRIAIFSENLLKNNGGAEVYALKLAEALSSNHSIEIFTVFEKDADVKNIYRKYHTPFFVTNQIKRKHSNQKIQELFYRIVFWFRLEKLVNKRYDYYINASCNRMIGFKNIYSIHLIHFPVQPYSKVFKGILGKIFDKYYRKSYTSFWANSEFTKKYLQEYWQVNSIVVNPPIDMKRVTDDFLLKKENTIIVVGRLVPDKKIQELLESFLDIKKDLDGYKLVVIGNKDTNYLDYYNQLLSYKNHNKSIKILSDISYDQLVSEYRRAKLFWHAKGVEETNPLLMEHFGMSTVEAMANGCVPIVINKAGQKEIVENGKSGFLWDSFDELKQKTVLLSDNGSLCLEMGRKAICRAKRYLFPAFSEKVNSIIK